jgi:hypothetical protein
VTEPQDPRNASERADLTGLSRLSDRPPPPRGEGSARVIRGVSILLLAVAAAGLPWYFLTKTDKKPIVSSTPSGSPSPSASSTASPAATPGTYEVFGVENCLRIREKPSARAPIVDCINSGVRVESDGVVQEAEGRLWRHVRDPFKEKKYGWSADQYLKLVS